MLPLSLGEAMLGSSLAQSHVFGEKSAITAGALQLKVPGARVHTTFYSSNSERGTPLWRIIESSVPLLISLWSGTGTVLVVPCPFHCMTI
jgi:hypothetical protein